MIDKKYRTQKQKLFEDSANRTPHYGIRKFTVGAASVLLSTTLWMGANAGAVHADTVDGSATTEQVNTADQSGASTAEKQALVAETATPALASTSQATASAQTGTETETAKQATAAFTESQAPAASTEQASESAVNTATSQATTESTANTASTDTNTTSTDTAANTASHAENATNTAAPAAVANDQSAATSSSGSDSATTAEVNAPAESQATSQSGASEQTNVANAAENTADKQNTVTLNVKDALKTSAVAKLNKKMAMVSLASTKLADQYEAKGAEYTEIYGQTIEPKNLISNFSELPTGTTASAGNLDAIKTKQGRNVVPVTVTYSDGSTDTANAIVWVTSQGATALAKKTDLEFNPDTNKSVITVNVSENPALPVYYKGTAVLDANTITNGAKIYLATIATKYIDNLSLGSAANQGNFGKITITDNDGDILGTLELKSRGLLYTDRHGQQPLNELVLNVTSAKKYTDNVNIRFSFGISNSSSSVYHYRSTYITDADDPYDYSGTIVQKRWLHQVGHEDKEYTINKTVPSLSEDEVQTSSPSMTIVAKAKQAYFNIPLFGYKGATSNKNNWSSSQSALTNKLYSEIWASKGKEKPTDLPEEQNYHEVFQVITPLDKLPSNFNVLAIFDNGHVQLATASGTPSDSRVSKLTGSGWALKSYMANDELTVQELYDQTPSGQIGVSKQSNGSFLFCFNLPSDIFNPKNLSFDYDESAKVSLSKDYDNIVNANDNLYKNNVVPTFATWANTLVVGFNGISPNGKWVMTNVTPGEAAYSVSDEYYPSEGSSGSGSADGKTQKIVSAYFVDDNQNQAVVGKINQVKGGVGDTVPLNMIIPDGYILATGQALPTSYTFGNTNSDVIVHLISLSKETHVTDTVNRTINYKTTDGSKAPESKSDSLTFYGTKTTGDLDKLVTRAGQDGLTVNKTDAKEYSTKEEALADLDKQASSIQSALTKYEAEKAAYDVAKKVYDQDLAKWNSSQNADHTVKGISQSLSFNGETDADLKVSTSDGSPVNYIKSKSWLGSNNKGVYSMDNIAKSFGDSDISYSFAEGTATDSFGWGKTYTGVQMKTGQSVIAQYTGLKNSVYIDSNGAAHKLSKVKISYTLNSTTANDGTANVFLSSNPNITLWFSAAGDNKDGAVDFTVDMTFYDQDGNAITLGKGSNAWLNMSSLNRGTTTTEYFNPNGNTTMEIPGSTIIKHDDGWYADSSNEANGTAWDSTTSSDRYYGASIMELEGNSFHVGKKVDAGQGVYSWNAIDSNLATAYKPTSPVEPTKPTVNWYEVSNTTWDGPKDFTDVESPVITGYTPNRTSVSNRNIAHDAADITEEVIYTPDAQKATVTYIDDETGKTLKVETLNGVTNAKSGYTTATQIKIYQNLNYLLVSDDTNGSEIVFDNDDSKDQAYTVHFKHKLTQPANDETYTHHVTITRTIKYVMSDGSTPPATKTDTLSFTGQDTVDGVTGQVIKTDWTDAQNFSDVTSPTIAGYTPDRNVVNGVSVTHESSNITETVTYTADKQYAHVAYVDDTDNKTLKTDDLEGGSNSIATKGGSVYLTADSIKEFLGQGYKLVSDSTNGAVITFDSASGTDQYYTVHLAHDSYTKDVSDDVHRTITYVVHGGNHSAPSPVGDNLHFTGVQTFDKVNNNLLRTDWEPNKDFADVTSPEIKGYTVDRQVVSNRNIAHDAADINEVVTYTAEKQYAHVKYVDDTDSKTLKTDDMEGESDTTAYKDGVPYTTAASIKDYISQGYKLVSDNTDGATIMLDHLTGVDQFYEVHLVHDTYTKDVADDVHRTVHYVVKGGNHAAPEDVEADLHFTGVQTWDKVTNQLLKTDWEPNKDFTDVDTPEIQGYTADRSVVSNRDISHDHADILEVVIYTADKQRAHVRYHDDTDNRDLKTVDLEGDSDTLASLDGKPYTTEWQINYYIDRGYAKVSDDTNGMTIMLDHVTGTDQYYNVHLVHTYQTITPKNPGDPNKPINPKGDPTPVWPPDTGAKDLQHDVLRNIHYIVDGGMDPAPDDVNDLLHFEETRVYDKVNGKLISDEWSPKQDFKDITSPAITGYTVDREVVINHDIEHNHADIKEVVHYVPNPQKAFVTYIDHTTGDTLAIKELDGVTHAKSGYTTYPSIVYYQGLGYQFISDTTDGKEIVYDNDDAVDQYYTVYLEHSYVPASPQNPGKPGEPINQNPDGAVWPKGTDANSLQHDVNRTINYVVTGGKDKAPDSVSDKLHFEAVAMVDRVTGEIVSTKWDEDKDFSDVKSPEIKGYTVDRKVVSNKDIEHNAKDIVETVTYNPDAQKASVTYIDKTTGKTLKTDKLDGVTHADSGYNTKGAIAVYTGLGYALVSDTTNGTNVIFDNDDAVDQAFTVTLEHTYITVTPKDQIKEGTPINPGKGSATYTEGATPEALQHDVKRNIHYVVSNGKKAAPADVNDSLHYEASAVIDRVTGDVVKATWSGNQDFKDVASPALKGYTVDKKLISNKNIGHDHADIKEVVTYAADPQKASVTYIDDTTGKNLDIKSLTGFTLDDSGYNTKSDIKGYVDLGYDLVSDSSNGAEIIFDDEDGVDQTYTVHLAHGKITVTEEKPGKPGEPINPGKGSADWPDGTDKGSLGKDVVRTITYKMVDGSKAPEGTSQTLHFTASKVIDKVTGQVLSTTWSGTQDFKDVESPQVAGYTPDQKVISDKGITHEHSNIDEVVTYVPDPQKALVTYYDDTNGKVLKADSLVGVTNKDSGYTTKGSIAGYINLGYKLVSDETGGKSIVFDNDDSSDQAYKVHLAHDYITVTPEEPGKPGQPINPDANGPKYPGDTDVKGLTDIVNREIDYVMSDGSKAPAAVKDSLSFTAKKTIDKATGEVVKTEWSANQDFKDVASPSIKGYTADKASVSNKNIAHDAADIKVVVKYTADAQKASVTYIDDNTGKSLKVDNLDGVTNAKSGYTTKSAIDTYTSLGYTLVSDDTNGAEVVFDNDDKVDQAFTVHFSHGTITVTPEKPGKPGEPINPGKGSANYPDDTDVKGLTDTVNRTITYVMSDGSKAPDAVKDTLSYTASKVIDKVTGQVLSTTWSKNQDFKDVDSPSIKGYTADTKTVSNKDVAHDAADISVVVKYTADAQKASVTYIDDATGKSLKVDNLDGVTNAKSGYTTKSAIDTYTSLGYTLVSDDTNGKEIVFDNDDAVDQAFTVHLGHSTITVTPEKPGKPGQPINPGKGSANYPDGTDKAGLTSTVTRTITYKMSDGSKAPDEVRQSLYFTGEKTIDKATGEVLETKWSANQDFDDVDSPVIAGYTASLLKASDKNISHDDLNIFVSVVYKADKQKATVSYIDDTTGKTIETKSLTGVSNEHSGYSTISTIKDLENRGYKLVSDDTTGSEIVFDTDDTVDQAYSVHLVHGNVTVTPESPKNPVNGSDMTDRLTKKVHQTIKYVTEAGKRLAKSNVQTLTFNKNATVDLVTGAVTSYGDWNGKKETKAVESPKVAGYTADTKTVEAHSYTAEDADKTFTVTYKAVKKAVNLPEGQPGKKEVPSPAAKPAKKISGNKAVPTPAEAPAAKATEKAAPKAAPAAGAETTAKADDKQTQAALPQTGESKEKSALLGLGLASILAGIGILGGQKRKKKEN